MNNMSLKRVNQWFTKRGDTYTVKKILKKKISFSVFDLFNKQLKSPPTSVFGEFDLIICANILIYYTKKHQIKILKKISNNLAKEGCLITGGSERSILAAYNYKEVLMSGISLVLFGVLMFIIIVIGTPPASHSSMGFERFFMELI